MLYTIDDLVAFGNYLLSNNRQLRRNSPVPIPELKPVSDLDIEEWKKVKADIMEKAAARTEAISEMNVNGAEDVSPNSIRAAVKRPTNGETMGYIDGRANAIEYKGEK